MNKFYKNGFIIKSYNERFDEYAEGWIDGYFGIGRFETWPLEAKTDNVSEDLFAEALHRWFGYQDKRLWVVPDLDYLQRYKAHCNTLNIDVFCLQIESATSFITSSCELPVEKVLGYDYADADMQTSCFNDDIFMIDPYIRKSFQNVINQRNNYGLANSVDVLEEYWDIRNKLISENYDMEEYFAPTIVRISKVLLE